jgi:hypothetical protein
MFSGPRRRWHWLLFIALLGAEFLFFDRLVSRHQAWIYPRWNDQIQYLTETYTGWEYLRTHGFLDGLWQSLVNPSAQGTLHDTWALLVFTIVGGPSRSAALAVNMLAFLAWQAALFYTVNRRSGSFSLAWVSSGLLLALLGPWSVMPGSAIDFRLDHLAMCMFGLSLCTAVLSDGLRDRKWPVTSGVVIGLTLLTRFLTGAYFLVIFAGLAAWIARGSDKRPRLANLATMAAIATAMAMPVFWLNRAWIFSYYFIGHFTGPESAIRSPHMGVGSSLAFVFGHWWKDHLGPSFLWTAGFALVAAVFCRATGRRRGSAEAAGRGPSVHGWFQPALLWLLAPALVLTLHAQKSGVVLSILTPGAVMLVLGVLQIARSHAIRAHARLARSAVGALAIAALTVGGSHFGRALAQPAFDPGFIASARKVNQLADHIFRTSQQAGLARPTIAVDQVTDSLDAQIMRVICYERQHVWWQFEMTLPTGITEEKEPVIMQRLADSDFVFLTVAMPGDGAWPYDRQMRRLFPQLSHYCEQNLRLVEEFDLFGRRMRLYERRAWPPPAETTAQTPPLPVPWPFWGVVLCLPAIAYAVGRRLAPGVLRRETLAWVMGVCAVGLIAATPFLTSRAVGSGEAYNYSLALADAMVQMREGHIPPLVGQTEFAFNGRIHPLRDAPWLFYLGAGLDLLTGRLLTFWQLQNLSLSFSLLAAAYACFAGLCWGAGCSRGVALLFTAFYVLCPALLAAAHWFDLYMTVHAAPLLPLALAASLREVRASHWRNDVLLAAALAAAWLAHPPVAFWLTGAAVAVRVSLVLRHFSWRKLGRLAVVATLFAVLSAFVFASVVTLGIGLGAGGDALKESYVQLVWGNVRAAFPGCLRPIVSAQADELGVLQLGYAHWLLLGLASASLFQTWRRDEAPHQPAWLSRLVLVLCILFLLILTLPVPGLTTALWRLLPATAAQLTNIWPMQRLYLVATALIVFASAVPLQRLLSGRARIATLLLSVLALGWTLFQAVPFVERRLKDRWDEVFTYRSHLSTNLNLTVTSYSLFETPPTFVNGVMDPQAEVRLLDHNQTAIVPLFDETVCRQPVLATGTLVANPDATDLPATLRLEPGRRYLLTFSPLAADFEGTLHISGRTLARLYSLPVAGNAAGFGLGPGNRHWLTLWTDGKNPEQVQLVCQASGGRASAHLRQPVAIYQLRLIEPEHLPIVVQSLLPLRCAVRASEAGCYLETPRAYLSGYVANVNGHRVATLRSYAGLVMVPIVKGLNRVTVTYEGAPVLRFAFGLTASAWVLLAFVLVGESAGCDWRSALRRPRPVLAWLYHHRKISGTALLAIILGLLGWRALHIWQKEHVIGPLRLRILLPILADGRAEPLVTTGRTGAGDFAYVRYVDEQHVRFGFDHWAYGGAESELIPVDFAQEQVVEIRMGSLYPGLEDSRWGKTAPALRLHKKNTMELLLNGRTVLTADFPCHPSRPDEVTVGLNRIGGSTCREKFTGEILSMERLRPDGPPGR